MGRIAKREQSSLSAGSKFIALRMGRDSEWIFVGWEIRLDFSKAGIYTKLASEFLHSFFLRHVCGILHFVSSGSTFD